MRRMLTFSQQATQTKAMQARDEVKGVEKEVVKRHPKEEVIER